ncbi:MAG: hypothetical protein QN163_10820 [Armatimonadota bacterium]|nr:hypothetical protein [Armatimonadota bacterium]
MSGVPHGDEAGLTLVELLVALCLLGAVLIATTTVLSGTFRAWRVTAHRAEEQQNVRLALEWMVRRLRVIGPTDLTGGDGGSVAFVADLGSGVKPHRFCLDRRSWVVRHQSGTDVTPTGCTRGAGITTPAEAGQPHVVSLEFAYFDAADNLLPVPLDATDLTRIRRIRIELKMGLPGRDEASSAMGLTAEVGLRGEVR